MKQMKLYRTATSRKYPGYEFIRRATPWNRQTLYWIFNESGEKVDVPESDEWVASLDYDLSLKFYSAGARLHWRFAKRDLFAAQPLDAAKNLFRSAYYALKWAVS